MTTDRPSNPARRGLMRLPDSTGGVALFLIGLVIGFVVLGLLYASCASKV